MRLRSTAMAHTTTTSRVIWVSNHPIPILLKAVPAGEQSFFCGSGWIGGVTIVTTVTTVTTVTPLVTL